MSDQEQTPFEGWCILELMGHRRLGGYVTECQIAGAGFLRIDVPGEADGEVFMSQLYSPSSVYCLTPCSIAAARAVAKGNRPEPIHRWEFPALPSAPIEAEIDDEEESPL